MAKYVRLTLVHDEAKAQKHHERSRDLELQIADIQNKLVAAEEAGTMDPETTKATHQQLHDLEAQLVAELQHQIEYRKMVHRLQEHVFEIEEVDE